LVNAAKFSALPDADRLATNQNLPDQLVVSFLVL
jgi:hypothetical protein